MKRLKQKENTVTNTKERIFFFRSPKKHSVHSTQGLVYVVVFQLYS